MFHNKTVLEWGSSSTVPKGHFISYILVRHLFSKGCVDHLVRVNDFSVQTPPIQLVLLVSEFSEVFPNYILGVLTEREIEFDIDILRDTLLIYILPYRMTQTQFKKLKELLKDLIEKCFIRSSGSPWGTPILFVRNKYGSHTMVYITVCLIRLLSRISILFGDLMIYWMRFRVSLVFLR